MKRTIEELRTHAVMWWPEELKIKDANASIIPKLLETQDDFLKLLSLAKSEPEQIFELLKVAKFPANLFLKHLTVLSDYGGEPLQRLGRSFKEVFLKDKIGFFMSYTWHGKNYNYYFQELPIRGLGNKKLFIDGDGLQTEQILSPLIKDVCMILLFGASISSSDLAGLDKCEIGSLIGNDNVLGKYVKQKYILVSRITGGATANNLGQFAQSIIVDYLKNNLGNEFNVTSNGKIKFQEYEKATGMPFDIVVENEKGKIGIEVSFQVTTNSTIERKAGQAAERQNLLHKYNYHIAYVIDGAGNFQRSSAISNICDYSDCTIAYSDNEFSKLAKWIRNILK